MTSVCSSLDLGGKNTDAAGKEDAATPKKRQMMSVLNIEVACLDWFLWQNFPLVST